MNTTVKWSIDNLTRRAADGVVTVAHWRATATATDGENTATSAQIGPANLEEGDPTSPDFVPYENLTEDQVLVWVKDGLGQERVDEINARLTAEAEQQLAPTELPGKPWEPVAPSTSE